MAFINSFIFFSFSLVRSDFSESLLAVNPDSTVRPWHRENLAPTISDVSQRPSTASMPVRPNTKAQRAGKLIVDMLPEKIDVPPRRIASISSKLKPGTAPLNSTVANTNRLPLAQPQPVLSAAQLSTGTPISVTDDSSLFYRVVVVHPTRYPTPRGTPQAIKVVTAVPAGPTPTHLLPPPARRPVFFKQTPEPSTSTVPPPAARSESSSNTDSDSPKSREDHDATIKPPDRRFSIQQAESSDELSAGSCSPEAIPDNKNSEPSPSREISGHITTSGIAKRAGGAYARRGKQVRHIATRTTSRTQVQRVQAAQRRANDAKSLRATTLNIGSNSSNGSKHNSGSSAGLKSHVALPNQDASNPQPPITLKHSRDAQTAGRVGGSDASASNQAQAQVLAQPSAQLSHEAATTVNDRGSTMSMSSEYETESDDNDSDKIKVGFHHLSWSQNNQHHTDPSLI